MFEACVMNDAACAPVIFLPVCAFTSLMNSLESLPARIRLVVRGDVALDRCDLVGEARASGRSPSRRYRG